MSENNAVSSACTSACASSVTRWRSTWARFNLALHLGDPLLAHPGGASVELQLRCLERLAARAELVLALLLQGQNEPVRRPPQRRLVHGALEIEGRELGTLGKQLPVPRRAPRPPRRTPSTRPAPGRTRQARSGPRRPSPQ